MKPQLRRLKNAMKPDAEAFESKRIVEEREAMEKSLKRDGPQLSEEEFNAMQQKIEDLNRKLLNVNTIPDDVLLNISSERFDWEKISIKVGFVYEFLLFN